MDRIELPEGLAESLLGPRNGNLRLLEGAFGTPISVRGREILLGDGKQAVEAATVERIQRFVLQMAAIAAAGHPMRRHDVEAAVRILRQDPEVDLKTYLLDAAIPTPTRKLIYPKSANQKRYLDAIRSQDLVFGIGPAGTGKTYLAAAAAVSALVDRRVRRVILARPAVEAGEKLGFLPGDLADKVDPFLRPLYDALFDFMNPDAVRRAMERNTIEVAPIAFMRGRTLNDAFVILDEAQNTTSEQMKMFLTRIGFGSKAVVTGDVTQIDLAAPKVSGLKQVQMVLQGVPGIEFVGFDEHDVVRHPLVQKIVRAYDSFQAQRE